MIKKLLLLTTLALSVAGNVSAVDYTAEEYKVNVNMTTGHLYRDGTTDIGTNESGWAKLWKSDKDDNVPPTQISVGANNMRIYGDNIGLAPGSGCTYTISCTDVLYYVAKVEFDFTSTSNSTTITFKGQQMTTKMTPSILKANVAMAKYFLSTWEEEMLQ